MLKSKISPRYRKIIRSAYFSSMMFLFAGVITGSIVKPFESLGVWIIIPIIIGLLCLIIGVYKQSKNEENVLDELDKRFNALDERIKKLEKKN